MYLGYRGSCTAPTAKRPPIASVIVNPYLPHMAYTSPRCYTHPRQAMLASTRFVYPR